MQHADAPPAPARAPDPSGGRTAGADPARERAALLGVLALAAVVRAAWANQDLWFDELVNLDNYVRHSFGHVVTTYRAANNHVLQTLASKACAALLGEHPWTLRLPALAAGVGTVALFHALARVVAPVRPALAGSILLALSYPHVYYCQNARGYSPFLLLALGAALLAHRIARPAAPAPGGEPGSDRPPGGTGRRAVAAYALVLGLALYTLPVAVAVVLGHGAVALLLPGAAGGRRALLTGLGGGVALAGLLYLPMAGPLVDYYTGDPAETGHRLLSAALLAELGPVLPLAALGALPAVALGLRLLRRDPVWTGLVFGPLAFNVAIPLLTGQGVHPRTFVYALPLAYLIGVEGLAWLEGRWPRALVPVVASAALASAALLAVRLPIPKQPFATALAHVHAERDPGDRIVGVGLAGFALGVLDPTVIDVRTHRELRAAITDAFGSRRGTRLWLLYTFPGLLRGETPELLREVETYRAEATFRGSVGDGDVHVRSIRLDGGGDTVDHLASPFHPLRGVDVVD